MHLVMELCEGGSVLDGLKDGEYSERQVGGCCRQQGWRVGGCSAGTGNAWCSRHLPHLTQAASACQVFQSRASSHQATPCLPVICCAPLRPLLQVAHIMRAVVRFIAQCHAKGLIYRDIKPGGESLLLAGFL